MENLETLRQENIHIHLFEFKKNLGFYSPTDFLLLLSSEERNQYGSFENVTRRHEFLWSRLLLRSLLSRYLKTEKEKIKFDYEVKGKPFVKNSGLHFNLSHAGNLIACSFALTEVGIDIEQVKDTEKVRKRCAALMESHFSIAEQDYLYRQSSESWLSTFFKIFTLKEAYVKALGRGLSLPFASFTVPLPLKRLARLDRWEYFSEIFPATGACLAHVIAHQEKRTYQYQICDWDEKSLIHLWGIDV